MKAEGKFGAIIKLEKVATPVPNAGAWRICLHFLGYDGEEDNRDRIDSSACSAKSLKRRPPGLYRGRMERLGPRNIAVLPAAQSRCALERVFSRKRKFLDRLWNPRTRGIHQWAGYVIVATDYQAQVAAAGTSISFQPHKPVTPSTPFALPAT